MAKCKNCKYCKVKYAPYINSLVESCDIPDSDTGCLCSYDPIDIKTERGTTYKKSINKIIKERFVDYESLQDMDD